MSEKQNKSRAIPPHTHCKICGAAIPIGKTFCSNVCMQKSIEMDKRMKRTQLIYLITFIILMLFTLVFFFIRPPQ